MRHWLKMRDFWTFRPTEVQKDKKHLFECSDSASDTGKSLLVRVAATHSGIVNGNMRFYRPDRMQDGVHSWTPQKTYPRPVLIGHSEGGQVLGRVLDAKYIDESYKYKSEHTQIRDSIFYGTDSKKKAGLFESVSWIVDNLMTRDDYTGLGYINLGMNITNPEAIQKCLRDEYLTVSVGFKTDSAVCSVCHTDWSVDDRCEHRLGEMVDGKQMFLICGHFDYEEVSFVNFPADPFATTISKEKLADSLERSFLLGLPMRDQIKSLGGLKMTDNLYGADIKIVEDRMPEKTVDSQATELAAALEGKGDLSQADKDAALAEAGALDSKKECGCGCGGSGECVPPTIDEIVEADRGYFSDADVLYAELEKEIDAAVAGGELTTDQVKDAKLSSEQRKGLSSGTFCGPGRSFPVPDCAHVTAARRLIGRASVSSDTKSKILACVSRKASSLGCGSKKDAVDTTKVSDEITELAGKQFTTDETAPAGAAPNEIVHHYDGLHKLYHGASDDLRGKMRNLHYSVGEHWGSKSAMEYYRARVKEHDKDFVVLPKAEYDSKLNDLSKLTADVTALSEDKENSETKLAKIILAYKSGLATQVVMAKVLGGADGYRSLDQAQIQEKVSEFSKRSLVSLKDSVADIMSELKWTEKSTTAPTETKPAEVTSKVNDNVQVADAAPPEGKPKDGVAREQAQKDANLHLERLAAMSLAERTIYMADILYQGSAK